MEQLVTQLLNVNFVYQVSRQGSLWTVKGEDWLGVGRKGTNCSHRDNLENRQLLGNCQIESEDRTVGTKNCRKRTYVWSEVLMLEK